ncbi:CPBP family intramembrane glutamic endopeptidase [Paracidobacterium acidisoli]|uniref:CPBP family intramembrane glutamic endopeptidase n=1 Tax=Paracidobacterium acidisoli TaxID=2303751 RepID=UPI0018F1EDB4|nr:type II CAAX endopeptidase family protein [Paracidobacterium acidisoli]MBT9330060.1 CPBP family intramembrane metalloprotease [Paracidobacterium acidisoli]
MLFAAVLLAVEFLLNLAVRLVVHPQAPPKGAMPPEFALFQEGLSVVLVALPTSVMALIEGRAPGYYGYQGKARAVRFFSGVVWGFAAISALVGTLWKLGWLRFDGQLLHGAAAWRYGAEWGVLFLMVGIFEESVLRGYLQFTIGRGLGFWWSALGLSFLFGFLHGHNPGESPVGLFAAGAVGLMFCLSLWYTGSLWWAVGFHAAWDWGESFFYGTSDSGVAVQGHLLSEHPMGGLLWSGGATGPEGSVLVFVLLAAAMLAMYAWWGRRTVSPFAGYGWRPKGRAALSGGSDGEA